MKKYFFEFDETGTIHKTIYYDAAAVPAQTAGEGKQLLAIDASALEEDALALLHDARMRPGRYEIVDGDVVARPPE